MIKKMDVTITCTLVAEDQYYLHGTRLAFDYPWAVYIVNGDRAIPYYRIYINNQFVSFANYEYEAYDYLLKLTPEQAHDPSNRKKEIKVEWCENWIKALFDRIHKQVGEEGGIECNCFWKQAEKSGLWKKGTYGSPMSKALSKLTRVETVSNNGQFCYNVFMLINQ